MKWWTSFKSLFAKKESVVTHENEYETVRARTKTKTVIQKYGVWGLMIFVMIPLPITGAYIGTIAAYIFGISYQKSLIAISSGIIISSIMVASVMFII